MRMHTYKITKTEKLFYNKYINRIRLYTIRAGCSKTINRILESADPSMYRTRTDCRSMAIFTNDDSLIENILNAVPYDVRELTRPDSDSEKEKLLNSRNIVLTKRPPKYRYRLYLYGKVNQNVLNLFDKSDDYHIGPGTYHHIKRNHFLTGHYFYVKSERLVTLMQLQLGDRVKKVEELIYQGTIDK